MQVSKESIIGDIVTANYKYAQVFKNVGIDFCCNGNRTIEQACEKKGIEATDILQQLQKKMILTAGKSKPYNYCRYCMEHKKAFSNAKKNYKKIN